MASHRLESQNRQYDKSALQGYDGVLFKLFPEIVKAATRLTGEILHPLPKKRRSVTIVWHLIRQLRDTLTEELSNISIVIMA